MSQTKLFACMNDKYDYHILVIDDNVALLQTLKLVLGSRFKRVGILSNPQLISGVLNSGNVDAVLLDMNFDARKLDGSDGLFWLDNIKSRNNPPAVVLITAFGDIDLAVESMKRGADDFVTKPWDNESLIKKLLKAIEKRNVANGVDIAGAPAQFQTIEEAEREKIAKALEATKNNMTLAAGLLGISRRTLYNKMQKYGL